MRKLSTLLILLGAGFLLLREEPDRSPSSVPVSTSTPVYAPDNTRRESAAETSLGAGCHPSYRPCLRADASDYDCEGGAGNGPYYTGEVRVVGRDVFGLDADGDGWGCDNR